MTELWERDAWELADGVRDGELRRRPRLLDAFLARIEKFDPELNAFCFLDVDGARARAAEIDAAVARGEDPGPWAGVPMGVKELVAVEGWPDTHASMVFEDDIAEPTTAPRRRACAPRRGARRAHDVARVRFDELDAHVSARHDPQPVEPRAHAGRFVGWFGGRGRRSA